MKSGSIKIYANKGVMRSLFRGASEEYAGILAGHVRNRNGRRYVTITDCLPVEISICAPGEPIFFEETLLKTRRTLGTLKEIGWFVTHPDGGGWSMSELATHEAFFARDFQLFLMVSGNSEKPRCFYTVGEGLDEYREPFEEAPKRSRKKPKGVVNLADFAVRETAYEDRKTHDPAVPPGPAFGRDSGVVPRTWHQEINFQKKLARGLIEKLESAGRRVEFERLYSDELAGMRGARKKFQEALSRKECEIMELRRELEGSKASRERVEADMCGLKTERIARGDAPGTVEEIRKLEGAAASSKGRVIRLAENLESAKHDIEAARLEAARRADETKKLEKENAELKSTCELLVAEKEAWEGTKVDFIARRSDADKKAEKRTKKLASQLSSTMMERDALKKDAQYLAAELKGMKKKNEKMRKSLDRKAEAALAATARDMGFRREGEKIIVLERFRRAKNGFNWKRLPAPAKYAAVVVVFFAGLWALSMMFPPEKPESIALPADREQEAAARLAFAEDEDPGEEAREAHPAPPLAEEDVVGRRVPQASALAVPGAFSNNAPGRNEASGRVDAPVERTVITYMVKRGDNLTNICRRRLGDASIGVLRKVAKENGLSSMDAIKPGMVLKLSK